MRARPSFLSLLFLLGAPLVVAFSPLDPGARLDGRPVLSGERAKAYETFFDEGVALRPFAVATWGVLTYALLGEGRTGVLIGEDGWLFTAEEFRPAEVPVSVGEIREVHAALAARGVKLVIALIPDKSRIYREHLGRYRRPAALEGRYTSVRDALTAEGVEVPDLLSALDQAREKSPVFLKTDTHWTPFGAQVAAEAVASALAGKSSTATFPFTTQRAPNDVIHTGDLMRYVPLGIAARWTAVGTGAENVDLWRTTAQAEADGGGLLGDVLIPGAVIGTSYSANRLWNFVGFLKQASGLDFLNLAAEGGGPLAPMQTFLKGEVFRTAPPRVIVWEIPERYLALPSVRPSANSL